MVEYVGTTRAAAIGKGRACWFACACAVLLFMLLPGASLGEVGVVSQCQLHANTSGFGVPIGASPYPQPVTFNVGVNGIVPQRLEARTSPNAIEITMSGGQAPAPQVSGADRSASILSVAAIDARRLVGRAVTACNRRLSTRLPATSPCRTSQRVDRDARAAWLVKAIPHSPGTE